MAPSLEYSPSSPDVSTLVRFVRDVHRKIPQGDSYIYMAIAPFANKEQVLWEFEGRLPRGRIVSRLDELQSRLRSIPANRSPLYVTVSFTAQQDELQDKYLVHQ